MNNAKSPLGIYIVWHPKYAKGKDLATRLYHHFDSNRYHNVTGGSGVLTLFRNANAPDDEAPLPVSWGVTDATAIVVLVDSNLTHDHAWVQYVQDLIDGAKNQGYGLVFPVIMEANNTDVCQGIHGMRWDQWSGTNSEREQQLFRDLTHGFSKMLRRLLNQPKHTDNADSISDYTQPISVFLSHSKSDGASAARTIRDWIHNNTSLSSFFDVRDIPSGLPFSDVIDQSIPNSAVVAIYTDSYSTRDWCKHEVIKAKREQVPMVVVDCLQTIDERAFPYLGNVPVIRMDPDKDTIPLIIGQLLDEVFKDLLWRCTVEKFHKSFPRITFMARPPELLSLTTLPDTTGNGERFVVYPDPPMSTDELELFSSVDHNMSLLNLTLWRVEAKI